MATLNIIDDIDKRIVLKFMKEGKTSRTYIIGLDKFMTEETLKDLIKSLPKTLGTSSIKKEHENSYIYGFSGDHVNTIYDILIKKKIASKDQITK